MTNNQVAVQLEYAKLQLAAEAMFGVKHVDLAGKQETGPIDKAWLTDGNDHSSRFTQPQADEFVKNWALVEHKANTETGFSGTLFKYIGPDNSDLGLVHNQLVMSFRSTEFIEDAARDNQETNTLEISETGWAFGQISDMESWYASLQIKYATDFAAAGNKVDVTGYSLGGHLATTFNLLHRADVGTTYTFNGAGVGTVLTTRGSGVTLAGVVGQFTNWRNNGNTDAFIEADALAQYNALKLRYAAGQSVTAAQAKADAALVESMRTYIAVDGPAKIYLPTERNNELGLLQKALERIAIVAGEAERVPSLLAGANDPNRPANIAGADNIAGLRLDYQLAVLRAGQFTDGYHTNPVLGGFDAYAGRNYALTILPRFFDVYGASPPSAVSNSQLHYGTATPVFIENQPLARGSVIDSALSATLAAGDTKLLVNQYNENDFGDTHSLVLMVDSLSVQNTLSALDPTLTQPQLNTILNSASAAKAETILGTQGKAEGDVLENVLDALRHMLLGLSVAKTPAKMEGGTWANYADRTVFYNNLTALTGNQPFKDIAGKVTLELSSQALGSAARNDFAALLALTSLSPVVLKAKPGSETLVQTKLGEAQSDVYNAWLADKNLTVAERSAGKETYTAVSYTHLTLPTKRIV